MFEQSYQKLQPAVRLQHICMQLSRQSKSTFNYYFSKSQNTCRFPRKPFPTLPTTLTNHPTNTHPYLHSIKPRIRFFRYVESVSTRRAKTGEKKKWKNRKHGWSELWLFAYQGSRCLPRRPEAARGVVVEVVAEVVEAVVAVETVVDPVVVARVVEGAVLAPLVVRLVAAVVVPVPWAGVGSLLWSKRPPSNSPAWATARTRWSTRRPFWAVSNRGSAIHPRTTKCRVCPVCPMRDVRLRLCPFAWACSALSNFFFLSLLPTSCIELDIVEDLYSIPVAGDGGARFPADGDRGCERAGWRECTRRDLFGGALGSVSSYSVLLFRKYLGYWILRAEVG